MFAFFPIVALRYAYTRDRDRISRSRARETCAKLRHDTTHVRTLCMCACAYHYCTCIVINRHGGWVLFIFICSLFESNNHIMEDLAAVEAYLRSGEYPSGINKGEKANLQRKCCNNYKLEGRVLYYKTVGDESESWKICVQSDEEKIKILNHVMLE